MRHASEVMYKIGKVFAIVAVVLCAIFVVIGVGFAIAGSIGIASTEPETDSPWFALSIGSLAYSAVFIITGSILLILNILALIFCSRSNAEIEEGSYEVKPRVLLIVFGALTDSPFFILSGIFSLIARKQDPRKDYN